MKKIMIKQAFFFALFAGLLTSCVQDDDTALPETRVPYFGEEFSIASNPVLTLEGWSNYAEAGTVKWSARTFNGDGYAQFNTFGSPDASNVGWLISPEISIKDRVNPKFTFRSAQNFVSNAANKLEVFVSTDYDGTNVLTAHWTKIDAVVADMTTKGYAYVNSGALDLTPFQAEETIHIGFKATGSGTNTSLDGLFQVDGLYVYTPN